MIKTFVKTLLIRTSVSVLVLLLGLVVLLTSVGEIFCTGELTLLDKLTAGLRKKKEGDCGTN